MLKLMTVCLAVLILADGGRAKELPQAASANHEVATGDGDADWPDMDAQDTKKRFVIAEPPRYETEQRWRASSWSREPDPRPNQPWHTSHWNFLLSSEVETTEKFGSRLSSVPSPLPLFLSSPPSLTTDQDEGATPSPLPLSSPPSLTTDQDEGATPSPLPLSSPPSLTTDQDEGATPSPLPLSSPPSLTTDQDEGATPSPLPLSSPPSLTTDQDEGATPSPLPLSSPPSLTTDQDEGATPSPLPLSSPPSLTTDQDEGATPSPSLPLSLPPQSPSPSSSPYSSSSTRPPSKRLSTRAVSESSSDVLTAQARPQPTHTLTAQARPQPTHTLTAQARPQPTHTLTAQARPQPTHTLTAQARPQPTHTLTAQARPPPTYTLKTRPFLPPSVESNSFRKRGKGSSVPPDEVSPDATLPASPDATLPAFPDATLPASPDATLPASPDATLPAFPDATLPASPDATHPASDTLPSLTAPVGPRRTSTYTLQRRTFKHDDDETLERPEQPKQTADGRGTENRGLNWRHLRLPGERNSWKRPESRPRDLKDSNDTDVLEMDAISGHGDLDTSTEAQEVFSGGKDNDPLNDSTLPTPSRRYISYFDMDRTPTPKLPPPVQRTHHSLRLHAHRSTYPFESEVRGEGYHTRIRFDPFGSGLPLKDQHAPRSQTFGNWSPRPPPPAREPIGQLPLSDRPPPPHFVAASHPHYRQPASFTASTFAHQRPDSQARDAVDTGYLHPPASGQPYLSPAELPPATHPSGPAFARPFLHPGNLAALLEGGNVDDGPPLVNLDNGTPSKSLDDGTRSMNLNDDTLLDSLDNGTQLDNQDNDHPADSLDENTTASFGAGHLDARLDDGLQHTSLGDNNSHVNLDDGSVAASQDDGFPHMSLSDGTPHTTLDEGPLPTSEGKGSMPTSVGEGPLPTSEGEGSLPTSVSEGPQPTSLGEGPLPTSVYEDLQAPQDTQEPDSAAATPSAQPPEGRTHSPADRTVNGSHERIPSHLEYDFPSVPNVFDEGPGKMVNPHIVESPSTEIEQRVMEEPDSEHLAIETRGKKNSASLLPLSPSPPPPPQTLADIQRSSPQGDEVSSPPDTQEDDIVDSSSGDYANEYYDKLYDEFLDMYYDYDASPSPPTSLEGEAARQLPQPPQSVSNLASEAPITTPNSTTTTSSTSLFPPTTTSTPPPPSSTTTSTTTSTLPTSTPTAATTTTTSTTTAAPPSTTSSTTTTSTTTTTTTPVSSTTTPAMNRTFTVPNKLSWRPSVVRPASGVEDDPSKGEGSEGQLEGNISGDNKRVSKQVDHQPVVMDTPASSMQAEAESVGPPISLSEIMQALGMTLPQFLVALKAHGLSMKEFTTSLQASGLTQREFKKTKGDMESLLSLLKRGSGSAATEGGKGNSTSGVDSAGEEEKTQEKRVSMVPYWLTTRPTWRPTTTTWRPPTTTTTTTTSTTTTQAPTPAPVPKIFGFRPGGAQQFPVKQHETTLNDRTEPHSDSGESNEKGPIPIKLDMSAIMKEKGLSASDILHDLGSLFTMADHDVTPNVGHIDVENKEAEGLKTTVQDTLNKEQGNTEPMVQETKTTNDNENSKESGWSTVSSVTLRPYNPSGGYERNRPRPYRPLGEWDGGSHRSIITNRHQTTRRPTLRPPYQPPPKKTSEEFSGLSILHNSTTGSNGNDISFDFAEGGVPVGTQVGNDNQARYPHSGYYPVYDNDPDTLNMSTKSAIMAASILGGVAMCVFLAIFVVVMYKGRVRLRRLPLALSSEASSSSTPPIYSTRISGGKGPHKTSGFWGTLKKRFDPYSLSPTPTVMS